MSSGDPARSPCLRRESSVRVGRSSVSEMAATLFRLFPSRLLDVSRSSLYYRPNGESTENLASMRRMDELHME